MLVFSKELLKTRRLNIVTLPVTDSEEDEVIGYMYTDLSTYNKALKLDQQYEGEIVLLRKTITSASHNDVINWFYEFAPQPIYMLAPYLSLIVEKIDIEQDPEQVCMYLDTLSRYIDFAEFPNVPLDLRVNILFNKATFMDVKNDYRISKEGLLPDLEEEPVDGITYISSEEINKSIRFIKNVADMFGDIGIGLGGGSGRGYSSYSGGEESAVSIGADGEIKLDKAKVEEDPFAALGDLLDSLDMESEDITDKPNKEDTSSTSSEDTKAKEEIERLAKEEKVKTDEQLNLQSLVEQYAMGSQAIANGNNVGED